MSSDTLVIEGVNLDLLDEQRQKLIDISTRLIRLRENRHRKLGMSIKEDMESLHGEILALDGVINMLDAWSDKRYLGRSTNELC